MRIHHLAIKVLDPERSLALYRDLLGLLEIRRWSETDGSLRSIWLALEGGSFLALERASDSGARRDEQPGHHCVALAIERSERERWRDQLRAAGVPIVRESAYSLFFRDHDENLLALSHFPDAIEDDSAL